jgi:hypothetical protein
MVCICATIHNFDATPLAKQLRTHAARPNVSGAAKMIRGNHFAPRTSNDIGTPQLMTKPAIDKPVRRKAVFTPYAVLWSMLGALGLGYLGVAIFEPGWLGDLTPAGTHAERTAEMEATVTKLAGDVDSIRSSMAKLELDVSSVKSDVAAQGQQTQTLGSQITALEDKVRLAETPVASAAAPAAQTNGVALASAMAAGASDSESDAAAHPATTIINAPSEKSQIVTGSVDKRPAKPKAKASAAHSDAINFGPAVVKRENRPLGLQLASNSTIEGLRQTWGQLAKQHHDKLRKLKARYTINANPANPSFNLVAGPLRSKAEAAKLCKDLQAQAVSCSVGDFTGNAL